MIEAQNQYRRRRGAPDITQDDAERMAKEDEAVRERGRGLNRTQTPRRVARALIVACGCRGRALGAALIADGLLARGTTRREAGVEAIEACGIEPAVADPDAVATLLDAIEGVSVVYWLLGSVGGEAGAALNGPRLERLLEELVDTPVRAFVYEAAGTAGRSRRRRAPRSFAPLPSAGASRSRSSIPIPAIGRPGLTRWSLRPFDCSAEKHLRDNS